MDIEKKKSEVAGIMAAFLEACPRFVQSQNHWNFLYARNEREKRTFTVANLVKTAFELYRDGYHALLTPTPAEAEAIRQREEGIRSQQKAAEEAAAYNTPAAKAARLQKELEEELEVEREWVRKLEIPLPGENEFQRVCRVANAKDARLRKKFPRPTPSQTPAASTVRNTLNEIRGRQQEEERQRISRNTPPIQPRGEDATLPFIHAEEARQRAAIAAVGEAAANREKK